MPDKRTKIGIAVAAAIIVIALAANGFGLFSQNKGPIAENFTVKASVNKDCSGTPWFVGIEKGFFKDAGINLVDVGEIPAPQRAVALGSGQIDVLDDHPSDLINLLKAGAPITGVAQSGDEPEDGDPRKLHMHWLVLENSSLRKASDILNMSRKVKVGVLALGTCVDTENNAWIRKNGIPKDKIEYVVLPDPQQEQALRQGLIDIAILHPPFFTAAESHGGVRILTTSKEAFGSAGGMTFLMFGKDFIKNHPEAVRRFIHAYKNAEKWSNVNRDEAAKITSKVIGLDNSTVHYYSDNGVVNMSQVQYWIDSLTTDGVIKPGEYKPENLYTDEFKDVWY